MRRRAGFTGRRPAFASRPITIPDSIYPHYNPGPNAVRVCNAHYEQEYRPSGTVIVPRMQLLLAALSPAL